MVKVSFVCPIYNKTNIINVKNIIENIKWINKTHIDYITINSLSKNNTRKGDKNQFFNLTQQEIIYIGSSLGGLTVSFCMFYILWEHCGLKEKIQEALQELILDYC